MKSSYYFDHDYNASTDDKILALRGKFNNWEGYGVFFGLLEHLCRNNGVVKREALGGLALGLSYPLASLTELIDFCISIDLLKESSVIYSQRINEHLAMRQKFSEAGRRGGLAKKSPPLSPPLSQSEAPLQAGEERREEEEDKIVKKIKVKDIELRKKEFAHTLKPYVDKYGKEFIRAFYEHWIEPSKSGRVLRFESERFWYLSKRLATWKKHEKFTPNGKDTTFIHTPPTNVIG